MPSLDRHLIGGALALLPSCLAVLWRRGQRNRCDFLGGRLVDAVACASRERGPIGSRLARKQRALTSRAFLVTDPRVGRADCRAFRGNSCALPARTTRLQLIQPLSKRRDRLPGSNPPRARSLCRLDVVKRPLVREEIGEMSAGKGNFHPRQSGFRRAHSSTPANVLLAPTVDPADGIPGTICRRVATGTTESEHDPHGRRSDAIE
jgi:hypothetical protein